MRRPAMYVTVWVLAAVIAVLLAWQGVGAVADQVTDSRPAPLSEEQVIAELESDGAGDGDGSGTSGDPGTTSTTSTSGPTTEAPTTSDAPATTERPPGTTDPSTTTGPPATAPTTTTTSTSTTPSPPQPAGETRSYSLVGGSAALRFTPTGVTVLWANPNPGFTVKVEPEHANGVKVEFESDDHESRVDGWWEGGPQDRTEEDDDT